MANQLSSQSVALRNPESEAVRIAEFMKDYAKKHKIRKFVLGVSGGLDSAAVLFILARAFKPEQILPVLLPERGVTSSRDLKDAKLVVERAGLSHRVKTAWIEPIVLVTRITAGPTNLTAIANIRSRVRMMMLYAVANSQKEKTIVVGTGDRSEEFLGYFTKYGDGGVDINPIVHLYKTEVRQLARTIGVPESVCSKPPSPGLVRGVHAKTELGADYDVIDSVLSLSLDAKLPPARVARLCGIGRKLVLRILERVRSTEHKRNIPPAIMRR